MFPQIHWPASQQRIEECILSGKNSNVSVTQRAEGWYPAGAWLGLSVTFESPCRSHSQGFDGHREPTSGNGKGVVATVLMAIHALISSLWKSHGQGVLGLPRQE